MTKYVFVTGGVLSGLGKGVATASIAKLFQFRGYAIGVVKIDPYLNVDPGTLNPYEHGEVFVCEKPWDFEPAEGYKFRIAEVDQDFGTYERFLDVEMSPANNITSGQVYLAVVLRERVGEYLGRTIQVIPHVTDEIKRRIREAAKRSGAEILLVEVGGTVGDIEGMPFLEAIRQFRLEEGPGNTALVHITLVPYVETLEQLKTKPTQHSVKTLQSAGLQPDVIIGRAPVELPDDVRRKISLFCNVPLEAVISDPDLEVVYELPLVFERQGLGDYLCKLLNLPARRPIPELYEEWEGVVSKFKEACEIVTIAMPGKYAKLPDSYISINEALKHAGAQLGARVEIRWLDTEAFEKDPGLMEEELESVDGVLLTPGFGSRGVEGMIAVAEYALERGIPFLGICFGAQLLFVAFCRRVMGYRRAHTTEVDPGTPYPVVDLLPEQKSVKAKGGTMRLGGHLIVLKRGTKLHEAYGKDRIIERFRHRYHIVPEYARKAEERGLKIAATDESGRIVNGIEIAGDPWIVGVQFHPEFKSRPGRPSPIYLAFVSRALEFKKKRERATLPSLKA